MATQLCHCTYYICALKNQHMYPMRHIFFLLFMGLMPLICLAQEENCLIKIDERDPFDSLRTVATEGVGVGFLIPSLFEEEDGPKLIDEATLLPLYSETDSMRIVFLTFLVPEYHYEVIGRGVNVKILTDSSEVIGLYNVPDEGVFDDSSNMRVYQHTCLVPMDVYYKLTYNKIAAIRINYRDSEHTIMMNEQQGERLRHLMRCLGQSVGFWPLKP